MNVRSPRAWRLLGDRTHDRLEERVRLPSVVRIGFALVIGLAGVVFLIGGVGLFVRSLAATSAPVPHPVGAALITLMLATMGYGFTYVGWRLLKARTATDALLGRRARLICGCVIAMAAFGMAWQFVIEPGFRIGSVALFGGLWAFWMFYSTLSHRQASREALRNPPLFAPRHGRTDR